ncbi:TonB-dependent receptor [Arcicella aquatica]|uniref:TonB-dependent receptor n=1 Tax=Arcicella aquatica TaxID=217141 RepID=A0ABU5QMT1_9BACT|nr:TonB-dependent receptor [Arcicella aquatica]MEA5258372.1 TonB-dependent receptor [Arcicella aquatica]
MNTFTRINNRRPTKWRLITLSRLFAVTLFILCYCPIVAIGSPFRNNISSAIFKDKNLRGRVTDENDKPLAGANIKVDGSTVGTVSDADGYFTLSVQENTKLIVSYIGYKSQIIEIGKQSNITIRLLSEDKNIDEVIVVGFGAQKKINLTGSVDAVSSKQLEGRPINNVASGLQGLIPNLNISNPSGRPSAAPSFNIRGITSINGGDPLVLVDNVPFTVAEVSRINFNDIESVTVLKDASSAAIYGARAAFGVVLITTKTPQGNKMNVTVNSNVGFRTIGKMPDLVTDPYQVMSIKHQAGIPLYNLYPDAVRVYAKQRSGDLSLPAAIIDPTTPSNWAYYGNTNWIQEAYQPTAPTYNSNVSISKRAENLSYYFSADYYQQDGLLKYGNDIYKRYNIRGKVDLNVTKWLSFSNNTQITFTNYDSPVFIDGNFFWNVNRTNSLDIPRNPDGSWTSSGAGLLGRLQDGGRSAASITELQSSFGAKATVIKGVFDIKGEATFRRGASLTRAFDVPIPYKTGPNNPILNTGSTTSWAQNINGNTDYTVFNFYGDLHKLFGKHSIQALAGFNQEYRKSISSSISRNNIISTTLPSIGLSTGTMSSSESIADWAVRGIFYRLGYSYNDKYLLELNGRYDGTSRFPEGKRWGFFPSVSAGWVVSDEEFIRNINSNNFISLLKLRGSYGILGNQASVGEYDYIPSMSSSQVSQILGTSRPQTVNAPGAVSGNFSWEKIATVNFGMDLAFMSNRLQVNFDKFTRYTNDMLIPGKALPAVFGTSVPKENAGDLKTTGWEFRLGWRDQFNLGKSPFQYNLAFNLADSRSYITRFDNPSKLLNQYYEGQEIGEIWGADIIGYFQNQEQLKNSPDQKAMGAAEQSYQFFVGDPIFADRNGDGIVNKGQKTVNDPGDMYKIGNSRPRYTFGMDMSASWKGFDLRVFMQGVAKRDWYPDASNVYFWGVFAQPWTNVTVQNLDHWTPENPDAYFPAIRAYTAENSGEQLSLPNKKYMQNAAYMRVKNITLGYTLPASLLKKAKIDKVRLFVSTENIFEITYTKVKLDPETLGSGSSANAVYPFQRTYAFGLNLNF